MRSKNIFLLILFVGLLVWGISVFNGFVWDDEDQIVNNAAVHSISNLPSLFAGGTFHSGGALKLSGIYYKPMMMVFFSLLYNIFGPNPGFFHLFQVVVHILNSFIVYVLLKYFFEYFFNKSNIADKMALIASLVFLLHPIQTEAVVYIAALQDVLYFFFGALGLLLLLGKGNYLRRLVLASLLIFLSLLCKETGILFLFISLTYFAIFKSKELVKFFVLTFFTISAYLLLRFGLASVQVVGHGLSPISRSPLIQRLLTLPSIFNHYLKTFIFPAHLSTAQYWLVKQASFFDFYLPFTIMLFFILLFLIPLKFIHKRKKIYLFQESEDHACEGVDEAVSISPPLGGAQGGTKRPRLLSRGFLFFLIWFFAGVGIHLQIFPLDMTVAERWFYFPMVGLLGILGTVGILGIDKIDSRISAGSKKMIKKSLFFVLIIVLTLFSLRTFFRILNWKDGFSLYSHDLQVSPDSFDLNNNLGVEYFRRGDRKMAEKYFRRSTELAPYWWTNWTNLGATEAYKQNWDKAEQYYLKAMANSDYFLAYENYAGVLLRQKKYNEAIEFLEKKALPKFPNNEKLLNIYKYLKRGVKSDVRN